MSCRTAASSMSRVQFITVLVSVTVCLPSIQCLTSDSPMDVRKFFPELEDDMTKVTWVHACNSQAKLDKALKSDVKMIEADIIEGHLYGNEEGPPIPVMGHPPDTRGDISLEQFLDKVLKTGAGKGIKLDFKSIEIFKDSENVLEQFLNNPMVDFPVWVNADILRGPGAAMSARPVDAHYFLDTCVTKFPIATISPGWLTDPKSAKTLRYNSTHVDEMRTALVNSKVVHPVTFPVHSGIACNSIEALTELVHTSVMGTSLTLWANPGQWVDYDKLRQLINAIGKDKVFIDMPEDMMKTLHQPPSESGAGKMALSAIALAAIAVLFLN